MDKNNLYQGLIQTKIIIILIIRTLRTINSRQEVIKQQTAPSPNVTKASDIFLMPGGDDMGQQIIPINKSGPRDMFSLWGE